MKKEIYTKDSEIFYKIIDVIYKLHPITKPRIDSWNNLCNCIQNPEMSISFYFYKDNDDSVKTQVLFLDGNRSSKNGISTTYIVDSEISKMTVIKLISFILSEFPYIRSLGECVNGFEINFDLGIENEEKEGISLSAIDIQFETHPKLYKEFRELFREYLVYIVETFSFEVSKTPQFIDAYKKYSDKIKSETICSLSYEELQRFTKLIDEKNLRLLLSNMDNDYFFELCYSFQKENKFVKRKVLELKGIINSDSGITCNK